MGQSKDYIIISKEDLKDTVRARANRAVGKAMKRFEDISDINTLKKVIKDLLHEEWRDFEDLLITGQKVFYSNYKDETDK